MRSKVCLFLVLMILVGHAAAQEEIMPRTRFGTLSFGANLQSWNIGTYDETVTQSAFPMMLALPVSERFQLTIVHTPGLSWRTTPGATRRLFGLSDTWIQGAAVLWGERLLLNFGMGIPTGKTRLTNDEYSISKSWLSRFILNYRVPTYGQGFCGRFGAALALPVANRFVVGFGGQYLYRTPYHPAFVTYTVADEVRVSDKEFQPGDEASANLGFEFGIGENFKFMLDAVYTHYWRDMQEDVEVYGPGARLSGHLGLLYRFDNRFLWMRMIYRQQGKNEVLQGLTVRDEPENTNGDQVELYFVAKLMDFVNGSVMFLAESRYEGRTDAGKGRDFIVGGGIGATYRIIDGLELDFRFKYLDGWYHLWNETYERVTTQGFEIFTGVRIEL